VYILKSDIESQPPARVEHPYDEINSSKLSQMLMITDEWHMERRVEGMERLDIRVVFPGATLYLTNELMSNMQASKDTCAIENSFKRVLRAYLRHILRACCE